MYIYFFFVNFDVDGQFDRGNSAPLFDVIRLKWFAECVSARSLGWRKRFSVSVWNGFLWIGMMFVVAVVDALFFKSGGIPIAPYSSRAYHTPWYGHEKLIKVHIYGCIEMDASVATR